MLGRETKTCFSRDKLACPAAGCVEAMVDEEDMVCEGPCKQPLLLDKTLILPCCGVRSALYRTVLKMTLRRRCARNVVRNGRAVVTFAIRESVS